MNTVVFTVKATDADNDKLIYSIDQTAVSSTLSLFSGFQHKKTSHKHFVSLRVCWQPDAEYFKVDLPNSGEVILSKPLDYETKNLLVVTIHASVSGVCLMSLSERIHTCIIHHSLLDECKNHCHCHYLRK